jgi:hypothetical protein
LTRARLQETARRVQLCIEQFYSLEAGPDVGAFVHVAADGARESLLLRTSGDDIEMRLLLPEAASTKRGSLDRYLQIIEGVSHFVYVSERARVALPATALELELQAEVDKLVVLDRGSALGGARAMSLHRRLYGQVRFLHPAESEEGHRYRLANRLAARLWQRLLATRSSRVRQNLQRFYRAGQTDKIRVALAA